MSNSFIKKSAYTLLDWITLGKGVVREVNGMKIRFPARWSRYYESNYEEDNYILLRKQVKPGMQVIDIGAHLGLFSVACSKLTGPGGKVISFEPTPKTFSVLKKTLHLNRCKNVVPVQAAVSKSEGTATFFVGNAPGDNSNSLVKNRPESELSGYEVKLVTIDSVVSEHGVTPGLIKIDAEGAELDVLLGGEKTFREYKPVLILGLHPRFVKQKGDSFEAIWNLLEAMGYEVRINETQLSKQEFCSRGSLPDMFDVHCFHK